MTFKVATQCGDIACGCGCVEVDMDTPGTIVLRDTQGREVYYDNREWAVFIAGVKDGQFDLSPEALAELAAEDAAKKAETAPEPAPVG